MNDLFQSIEESKDERQAIQMADGITTTADELHRCEVSTIVRRYFPEGDPKPFFAEVEKKRGKNAADKLRTDCRKAWQIEVDNHRAMRENVARDSGVNK